MNSTNQWSKNEIPPISRYHYRVAPMKRKNFSVDEITLLKRLIQKYRPNQIENKKTDSVNLGEKQRIWESITKEFNSHFHYGDETSVKQLRKLWDNLKTRRKNELLRERLVLDEDGVSLEQKRNTFSLTPLKDDVSDSMDSNTMSIEHGHSTDDTTYMNGSSSQNWTLPIETVIVEDEEQYKEFPNEDDETGSDKQPFQINSSMSNDDRCHCNFSKKEIELREKKLRLIFREEEELYKLKKSEQQIKNDIASVQLRILLEKREYLTKKRKLQLQLLSKQLSCCANSTCVKPETLEDADANANDIAFSDNESKLDGNNGLDASNNL